MSRPNFYILLELDCSVDDAAKIDAAVKAFQLAWGKLRNHPKKGRDAQQNLGLLPKIREVMGDDELRKQEAEGCKQILKDRAKAASQEMDEAISIVAGKGHVTESELKRLVTQLKGRFTELEIRKRIPVPVQKDSARQKQQKPVLETSLVDEIRNRLSIVNKSDLYGFLDCPKSSSLQALQNSAKSAYAASQRNNNKTAEVTAAGDLAGICMKVFKTDADREKYENAWERQGLRELEPLIQLAGTDGIIDSEETEQLLKQARKRGISVEDARDYIVDFAAKSGFSVQIAKSGKAPDLPICGSCGSVNAEKDRACRSCGEPLTCLCPKCQTMNSSEARACTSCGFKVGDRPIVMRLIREAEIRAANDDLIEADRLLAQARIYWLESEEIRRCEERINQKKQLDDTRQERLKELEIRVLDAVARQCFVEGRRHLVDFRNATPDQSLIRTLHQQIEKAISEASQHVKHAQELEKKRQSDEALDAYQDAINVCRDYKPAQDGLSRHPPQAPSGLTTTIVSSGVGLRWKPSASRGNVEYRIVRKQDSAPASPADGADTGSTAGTTFTDSTALPGVIYYYAVYAVRGGIVSLRGVTCDAVVRITEVAELSAVGGDLSITLNWQIPPEARSVEIWRNEGRSPSRRGEGTMLRDHARDSAVDHALLNGVSYGYRVVLVFDDPAGRPLYSNGVTCTAIPAEPPKPVRKLRLSQTSDQYQVTWKPVTTGDVEIHVSDRPSSYRCGYTIPRTEVSKLGKRVPPIAPDTAQGRLGGKKIVYLTPVTIVGTTAVVGQVLAVSCVEDVRDLTLSMDGSRLTARWTWPHECKSVTVALREGQYATGHDDNAATLVKYSEQKYLFSGGFCQEIREAGETFVTVFASLTDGEEVVYASGTSQGCRGKVRAGRSRTIRYQVCQNRSLLGLRRAKGHKLTLRIDHPAELPELLLVGRPDGMPLNRQNGTVILRIQPTTKCNPQEQLTFDISSPSESGERWEYRLFTSNDEDSDWLNLIPE